MKKGIDHIGVSVVFMCHDGKGNYLVGKRTNKTRDEHGRWDPGAGAVNLNESIINTLKREIKEEYCTTIIKIDFLGYRDVRRLDEKKRKTHWISLDFRVLVDRKKVKIGEPKKFSEIRWVKINKIPHPMHSQFPYFLKIYKSKLK